MQTCKGIRGFVKAPRMLHSYFSTKTTSTDGSSRPYDIVVFGSTGYTGKFVNEELYKLHKGGRQELKWAAAGRSKEKIQRSLQESGVKDVDVIEANVSDPDSLNKMCSQTSVLINTVGPYQVHGEPVVKACISEKTNYVDITGEPYFMESIAMRYNDRARDSGVYVVSSCGFDCIPNDLGALLLQRSFEGDLAYVESHMAVSKTSRINTGTWDSFLRSIRNHWKLSELIKRQNLPPLPLPRLQPPNRGSLSFNDVMKRWSVPFPGPDKDVVYKSMRYRNIQEGVKPFHFSPYLGLTSSFEAALMANSFWMLMPMVMTDAGLNILLKFPELFSGGSAASSGPSRKELEGITFTIILEGVGYSKTADKAKKPNSKTTVKVSSTVDPGYGATSTMLVQAALCFIDEKDKLPLNGGVYTPAVAFGNTSLIQNLNKTGRVKFKVIQKKD